MAWVIRVTDLEVEEAIREAWAVLQAGPGLPASARRLAAALLALTTGSPTQPHWVTPDDLWRDRLAVLAEQGAWRAAWGPRPGEPGCRVPPTLLPAAQAQPSARNDCASFQILVMCRMRSPSKLMT